LNDGEIGCDLVDPGVIRLFEADEDCAVGRAFLYVTQNLRQLGISELAGSAAPV
jgi:hypothetical protein